MDEKPVPKKKGPRPNPTHAVIRLAGKRRDSDPDFVSGSVSGDGIDITYALQREVLVPVRWPIVESLRNAVEEIYTLEPGKEREFAGTVQRFPFEIVARTTEEQHAQLVKRMKKAVADGAMDAVTEEDLYDVGALGG